MKGFAVISLLRQMAEYSRRLKSAEASENIEG